MSRPRTGILLAPFAVCVGAMLPLLFARPALATEEPDACVDCHSTLEEDLSAAERITGRFAVDVHRQRGLGCADCHGGNPTAFDDEDAAMWEDDSFRGVPDKTDLPAFCGRCHSDPIFMRHYRPGAKTDQENQYYTSRHGQALREGEERVASCTNCHGAHGILEVSHPNSPVHALNLPGTCASCHADPALMTEFGLPADQYDQYAGSVHGTALLKHRETSAPACNDCHGNHGAVPPGIGDIANICGNCHVQNHDMFLASPVGEAFRREGLPLCESCHGKHAIERPTDAMFTWTTDGVCVECHERGDVGHRMAAAFHGLLDTLRTAVSRADSLIERAEQRGMEISDLLYHSEDALRALIQTRTAVHSFDAAVVRDSAHEGIAAAENALAGAHELLAESRFRRQGLFGASLIITFLVVVLYLKLRQIEARQREESGVADS